MPDPPRPGPPTDEEVDRATVGPDRERRAIDRVSRIVLPAVLIAAAVVVAVLGSVGLGVVLLGAAVLAMIADLLIRVALVSQDDREEEARARRVFRRRGTWPEDPSDP